VKLTQKLHQFFIFGKNLRSRKKKFKIVKKIWQLKLRAWATDAQALALSFLDPYPKTVPAPTKFKRSENSLNILIAPFKG
jgi:hypothetical protein